MENLPENHLNLSSHNPDEDSNQTVMVAMVIPTHQMESPSTKTSMENSKDSREGSNSKDHSANLTKVPTPNGPESQVDLSTKIKSTALDAKNLATCKKIVQNKTDLSQKTHQDPRSLRIIPILTQDLMCNLPCPDYSNQPMATNYDQALGAIKDSLNTANPLASLNL